MASTEQTPLRKIRHARGLSLEEVARKVGTDSGNLSRIELGRQSITRELAASLASFYGSEICELHIFYPERYSDWSPKAAQRA